VREASRPSIRMRWAAAVLLAFVAPAAAPAQPASDRGGEARASFDLVRGYLRDLRNPSGKAPAAGPGEFRLERKAGESLAVETAPIGRLTAMLRNCRKASFRASWGNPAAPARAEGRQYWECLGEGAEDKAVLVTASSSDGKSIDSVTATLGGEVAWPGPAPNMSPPPTRAQAAAFEANRERVSAFLGQLAAGDAPVSPPEVILWSGKEKSVISVERARELLAPCERIWAYRHDGPIEGVERSGVSLGWKCDKRSGAYADLAGLVTVKGGAIEQFYISPYLDYAIPPSASGQD